jgi:hypothetical protein
MHRLGWQHGKSYFGGRHQQRGYWRPQDTETQKTGEADDF